MDLFNGIGRPMMRLVEKHLFVWFTNLFPFGVVWKILAACIFVLIATVILTSITVVLLRVYSREEQMRAVTMPFRHAYGVAGVVFGIMTLVDPEGIWNVVWHSVFILGFIVLCCFLYAAIEKIEGAPRSRRYYWCIGLSFALEMFIIGFYAFTVFIIAIIFSVLIILGIAYFRAGIAEMMRSPPPCLSGGGMGGGNQRVKLEDGTVIEESGASWYEVGGPASYHKNMDGTFTKD